jgi:Fe-Mn family superoxide dismutase
LIKEVIMPVYSLPDLAYGYRDLEPLLAAEILELHHAKHHAAYVNGANAALEALDEARERDDFDRINQLEKNLAFHVSGHVLHSLLWRNLAPDGSKLGQALADALRKHFGGLEPFKAQMTAAAAQVQGSGWAALCWEPWAKRLTVQQILDHQDNSSSAAIPLLVIDMWEHAYYLQYRNDKEKWIDAFWELVNWPDVERRLTAVSSFSFDPTSPS